MKNILSFSILAMVIALLFTSCKKYEEGPALTLRSVKNRLTNGDWELEKLTIDGIDSTLDYKEMGFEYTFTATTGIGAREYSYTQIYTYQGQQVEVTFGNIVFSHDGDKITFETYDSYSYTSPIFGYDNSTLSYVEWDITKLTNTEFWLETKVDGMPVLMKLKKNK